MSSNDSDEFKKVLLSLWQSSNKSRADFYQQYGITIEDSPNEASQQPSTKRPFRFLPLARGKSHANNN